MTNKVKNMKQYYYKLVRDKIPEVIKNSGGDYEIKILRDKKFEKELIKKVGEEASGLIKAKDREELAAEIADVLDVIEEIITLKAIDKRLIKAKQKENNRRKGGFKKKLFLIWSSGKYKSNEIKYDEKGQILK